ncbi:hypothetical protein GNI_074600 [Gregarina niphandrodes]|uniref:Uncharacterized protein n=1 Tax=Gregarina niphandrodes TaxID=110365 RepID=A0A023B701_GRENI|nr:hypothetical protein GNI_074600 [Gregarina niphandrodes]EZG66871.1 hypothetical protein GNI_074600 [Gregarina niphandrodes]|eukprot:XP_011130449.1 hypothetical protein GNI_074600 [Gregarina niphandrodes]
MSLWDAEIIAIRANKALKDLEKLILVETTGIKDDRETKMMEIANLEREVDALDMALLLERAKLKTFAAVAEETEPTSATEGLPPCLSFMWLKRDPSPDLSSRPSSAESIEFITPSVASTSCAPCNLPRRNLQQHRRLASNWSSASVVQSDAGPRSQDEPFENRRCTGWSRSDGAVWRPAPEERRHARLNPTTHLIPNSFDLIPNHHAKAVCASGPEQVSACRPYKRALSIQRTPCPEAPIPSDGMYISHELSSAALCDPYTRRSLTIRNDTKARRPNKTFPRFVSRPPL